LLIVTNLTALFYLKEVDGAKETKHVRQYQLHDWVTDVQPDVTGVLDLRRKVVEFTKDNDSIPIIHSGLVHLSELNSFL